VKSEAAIKDERGIEWDYQPDQTLIVLTAQPESLVTEAQLIALANTVASRLS
jgi:hypothetical protein